MAKAIPAALSVAGGIASAAMSSGKGSGGTQTQTTQTSLPGWIEGAAKHNWDLAVEVANQLKNPYGGPRVAEMTPESQNIIAQLYGNIGSTNPAFANASGATNTLMGFNPSMINPSMLRDTDLNPYMNPFTKSVIDPSLTILDQSLAGQQNATAASAVQNRAFGGSRHGIQEAVNNAQTNLLKGQLAGQLNSANFQQAQQAATGDITRDMAAQQLNQAAGQWGAQFRGNMANQLAGLATQGQQSWLQGMTAAMQGQGMLQAQDQAKLDAARQLYEEQRQQPLDVLKIRQNALAMTPYGQTQTQTGPGPSTSPMATGLGTASTIAGLLGSLGRFGGGGVSAPGSGWIA